MDNAGTYRFVLHFYDDYADSYKNHKVKAALEVNAIESPVVINLIAEDLFKSLIPETEEENPGAFVHFNLDNDNDSNNNDGAPKHPGGDYIANETHGPVNGEDDLKRAKIFFGRQLGRLPNEGKVVLRVTLISGSRHMRVWKNPEKGAGNDVLVTVQEKGWDLSDPVQRQTFSQIKENLWVEGIEYNSKCWLEVEYKKQVGGQWQSVGLDKVKYTFIAADCGDQPKTEAVTGVDDPSTSWPDNITYRQRAEFESSFPNLKRCEWSILDNSIISTKKLITTYNCIAYSVDETGPWWYNPVYTEAGTNIKGIDQEFGDNDGVFEVSDLDAFYQTKKGWKPTASGPWDAEAMYYPLHPDGKGYHAARRRRCSCGMGKWIMFQSKCGKSEAIEHVWNQLNGDLYGSPTRYYK